MLCPVLEDGPRDAVSQWRVRPLRCFEVGASLRGVKLSHPTHFLTSRQQAITFEFVAASICHGVNWDTLRRVVVTLGDAVGFDPKAFSLVRVDEFSSWFAAAFPEVKDLERRHQMMTEAAALLAEEGSFLDVNTLSETTVTLGGSKGLYALLDAVETFREDPQRKKQRILLQQLYRYGLLDFADPENLRPATEYHIVRLYLRTERVEHFGSYNLNLDRTGDVRTLTALRLAVEQAMHYTASSAGLLVPDVNEIEWQLARSYCERHAPRCDGPQNERKLVATSIVPRASSPCPFAQVCQGPTRADVATIREPQLAAHHSYY